MRSRRQARRRGARAAPRAARALSERHTHAGRAGAVEAVLRAVRRFASHEHGDAPSLLQALATLKARRLTPARAPPRAAILAVDPARTQALLCEDATRDSFVAHEGVTTLLADVLERQASAEAVAAGARVASAAAARHETAKVALFKAGAAQLLLAALSKHVADAALAAAACWALSALATADDRRVSASAAFAHGRQLHQLGAHAPLMAVMRQHAGTPATAAAACSALRAASVNDEACVEVAEAGGVESAVALLAAPGAARAALGLLRQLAGADAIKPRFVAAGGLQQLLALLGTAGAGAAGAALSEAGLTMLAALTLRNPEGAAAAAAAGALDAAVELMARYPAVPGLQRAACMYLRNSAARNLELRPLMLERGAEPLLRAAKAAHPGVCTDVGSAALRDLGAADYNAGWTPTTVYMGAGGELYSYEDLGSFADDEAQHEQPAAAAAPIAAIAEEPEA
jgi:hypothetical protein